MRAVLFTLLLLVTLDSRGATFTVNRGDDAPISVCTLTECTLRAAMLGANANAGADSIAFNVPAAVETAAAIGQSPRSVNRLWTAARAWLIRELGE